MKLIIQILTVIGVIGSPVSAQTRFTQYQPTPLCGDAPPLDSFAQGALGLTGGSYIGYLRIDEKPKEIQFSIVTPGAFLGEGFSEDICGSQVELMIEGTPMVRGLLEYVTPNPSDEHQPYPYIVHLEGTPARTLRFSRQYDTVWGIVDTDAGIQFFTGANIYRWE